MKKTLIVGASTNPERYAYKAAHKLKNAGHEIVNFGVKPGEVAGVEIVKDWSSISNIHTVTLYVGPKNQINVIDHIIALKPQRVIFNPGTENELSESKLREAGIEVEEACTLVLLSLNAY